MDTGIIISIIGIVLTVAGFFMAKTIQKNKNKLSINKSKLIETNIVFGNQINNRTVRRKEKNDVRNNQN